MHRLVGKPGIFLVRWNLDISQTFFFENFFLDREFMKGTVICEEYQNR